MIYAENVLAFLVAPMIVGMFFLKGETKQFIGFFLMGVLVCLLCSYVNGFVTAVTGDFEESVIRLTPIVEESIKALPLLFYFVVFRPSAKDLWRSAIALGIGFATYENCCHVILNGAESFSYMLVRGFAAGIMHVICAMILGRALIMLQTRQYILALGIFCAICMCIAYHSVYNLLVSSDGVWQMIGYFMPIVTVMCMLLVQMTAKRQEK